MEGTGPARIGLALGGGTARGMAHVGALAALRAAGRTPVAYAGSSFGALVAAMAALGLPVAEIDRIVRHHDARELWRQALDPGFHRAAMIEGGRLARWLDRTIFRGARVEEAERPLAIVATDLATGEPVVLRAGPVAEAVRASCALPGLFAPVVIDGRVLVDGGFVEPVPFAALAGLGADRLLGVHAGLDLRGSRTLARLRALEAGRPGRLLRRVAARSRGAGAWGRLLAGLALSLGSYRHDARAPAGAVLVHVDPGIAWWDFQRPAVAIEAGERAVRRWLLGEAAPARGEAGIGAPVAAAPADAFAGTEDAA